MTIWLTDDEGLSGPAATSPPTPAETPFRTPSRPPKMTRRSVTPPPKGPTPPPGEAERQEKVAKRSSRDVNKDETISPLDPRRFTPTLHANLVSEILTLRRDQEDKTKIIESLEIALTSSREDQESLRENLSVTAKENRSTKRQLALLEGGTSSALGELARERDDAVEQASDVKKRLEAAQKKLRVQEDDSQRVHDLWAKEKDAWEDEKRKFERKIHIAETRLKAVLDEVAAFQAAQAGAQNGHESDPESMRDTDVGSVRSMSIANSARYSTNFTDNRANGNTLADELDFEGDDDYDTDLDGRESVLSRRTSLRHTRNFSRDSVINRFHRKNKSIDSISRRGSLRGTMLVNYSLTETLEPDEDAKTEIPSVEYEDRGVQCSPPSSPEPSIAVPSTPELAPSRIVPLDEETTPRKEGEYEANQRRKRVQVSPLVIGEAAKDIAEEAVQEPQIPSIPMVSIACQTVEEPVSPPKTPPPEITLPEMVTSCTQTDEPSSPVLPPLPLPIPSISIQPPTSRPTTPREPRLPPNSKHFGCQVNISWTASNSDASIQTEGIQVDKRIAQLPRHLQPSSVTSRPNSPIPPPSDNLDKDFNLPPAPELPSKSPRRFTQQSVNSYMPPSPVTARHPIDTEELHLHDAYPGNNDDGPLSSQKDAPIKRPQRFSSLFAGFDTASSDDGDDFGVEASDSEYQTPLSARPPFMSDQLRKRGSSSTGAMSPEPSEQVIRQGPARSLAKPLGSETYSSFSMVEEEPESPRTAETTSPKPHERASPSSSRKMGAIRKTALIQSGIASHNGRPRSPSVPEGRNPPFPIPTRASSRRPPASSSAPSEPPSPTRMDHWPSRGPRNAYRTNSIRKVRSAAALARKEHTRKQSRSPPPLSPSSGVPESPAYPPPLPRNELTTPRGRRSNPYKRNRRRPSTNTERTDAASANDQAHTAGVVDAIAQTMVGEWMFKYVRRRKSFTVNESNNKDDTGNERHKRWVWLAPYERAILWSSKQPNSGTALMGKAGRKLTIQSVLDVKDDNPTPRGATSVFDRSILILTPQRALKFTASTSERHYIWLTALSFLAHSQQTVPEILSPAAPPSKVQSPPDGEPIQKPRGRRPGIRDSIRLAKGRSPASSAKAGTPSVPSIPSAPASHAGEPANFLIPESIGAISSSHVRDESEDIAVPPMVPRFNERGDRNAVHGRKRSNTGGHVPPPLSFRGFSNPPSNHRATGSTADASIMTAGSSDFYQYQGSAGPGWGTDSQWSASQPSHRPSEASSRPGNFFDAIGTVRMEAFISPLSDLPSEAREYGHVGRRRSKDARRRRSRSRQRDSYSYRSRASEDRYGGNRTAGEEDFFRDDPFRGF